MLDFLRVKSEKSKSGPNQLTNADMKLSATKFAKMISTLGYEDEANSVESFLNGNSEEYDYATKEHSFTLRSIYRYR